MSRLGAGGTGLVISFIAHGDDPTTPYDFSSWRMGATLPNLLNPSSMKYVEKPLPL